MLKRLMRSGIHQIERRFGYDATYMHEMLDASGSAFFKFSLFQVMSQHQGPVPTEAAAAARIGAVLVEDCGPCVQITVDMALAAGVSPEIVAALLKRDWASAGPDASLAFKLAEAAARNAPEAVELSQLAERRWGKAGLVAIALGAASARVYPTVKRAMGHGAICEKVRIEDRIIEMDRAA